MTITHSVPTTTRRPMRAYEFNVANAQRGLVPIDRNLALVGTFNAAGSATAGTIYAVSEESKADSLFGQGSELALMCKWALKGFRAYGKSANLYAIGITPVVSAAAVETLTTTGTASASGDLVIRIAGRTIRTGVTSGDVQNTITAALEAAIDAEVANLPVTAGSATNVVTCTHVDHGVNGNDVLYEVIEEPAGVSVALAQSAPGAGAVDITASLDLLIDRNYHVIAIANKTTTDTADLGLHLTSMWAAGENKWRFAVMAERGTLAAAQLLADDEQTRYDMSVISAEGFRNTGGEIAAYGAAILAAEDDPAQPFNGIDLPDLYMPTDANVPTNTEIETGIAGGLTMLTVNDQKTSAKMVRYLNIKTVHNSVAFLAMQDITIPRSMAYTAEQVDIRLGLQFGNVKKSKRNVAGVRSEVLDVLYKLEELEVVQNVDDHTDELVVETDANVATRLNVAIPTSVVPPLNQIIGVVNLLLE